MTKITKKVRYIGMADDFTTQTFFITRTLSEKYELVECDDPDYIICSAFSKLPYEYCNTPQVRLFYSGENFAPDFNLVDYAIGSDDMTFGDRYFRHSDGQSLELESKDRRYGPELLAEKDRFANFIAGHESEYSYRGDFFKKLCAYKRVDSLGTYLNNMPDGRAITRPEKLAEQRRCKFTLCFESTSYRDFCTEKLVDAFLADTIPIYYGDPNIGKTFNTKAFINCADYASYEDILARIKELDEDDDAYMAVMREPIYTAPDLVSRHYDDLRAFLFHIFDQPIEQAYRRSRVYLPKQYDDMLYRVFREKRKRPRRPFKTVLACTFKPLYQAYKRTQRKAQTKKNKKQAP